MGCHDEEAFEGCSVVTRVVSLESGGSLEQVHYYVGSKEIARETYDGKGSLTGRSGTVPDGTVKEYYGNGALKKIVPFRDGGAHGKSVEYYISGEVFEEDNFCHGLLHGLSRMYRRDGTLWTDDVYKDGRLHGISKRYHDNGNLETRAQYKNGSLNGPYARYDRYGCLQEKGIFNDGKKEGDYALYHETGHPARIERYVQGRLTCCQEFDEDGNTIAGTKPEL